MKIRSVATAAAVAMLATPVAAQIASPVEGMRAEVAAWYWNSSETFDVDDARVRVAARCGSGDPLLSGWVLGGEHIAGQPAVLEADIGQGSVVLFGFRPTYGAQTVATWPLLFNAMSR